MAKRGIWAAIVVIFIALGLFSVTKNTAISMNIKQSSLSIQKAQPSWRTQFLAIITNPSVAYLLLMLGFYGLFFEFAHPGFILPGVVGTMALLLALYAFHLLPINYVGLGLIFLAIVFFIMEAFVTSFGTLAIGGVISFIMGSLFLFKHDATGYHLPIYLIITVVVITAIFFLMVLNLAVRARHRPIVSGREALIGKQGKVEISDHRIWVNIDGERWQCKSDVPLSNGQEVSVESLQGLIFIVKAVKK